MATEKKQKKKRFGGRLLTTTIVVLCVAGVCIIAYPFALTGIMEYNKNEVVRQLEAELPIYRNPEDFEPVDIAAMQKVDPPTWTAEEKAQAANPLSVWETLLGEDTRSAITNVFGGGSQERIASVNLPVGELATLIPQAAQADGNFATLAPREASIETAETTDAPATPLPEATAAPVEAPAGDTTAPQATNPPATVGSVSSGAQVATTPEQATTVPQAQSTDAPQETAGPVLAEARTESPLVAVADPADATETAVPRDLEAERQAALAEILRDEAPVYYEDFADTMVAAESLYTSMSDLSTTLASKRQHEIPGEVRMTFQGIQAQFLSMQNLFTVVDDLPSASETYAVFPRKDGNGEEKVLIYDGVGTLYETLKQLSRAHVTIQTVAVYSEAVNDVQLALDETVYISDQLQNVLDYMAKYLSDTDSDLYTRYRASSLVGETEAEYLLEIPSINLQVGVFPDLTFEQMYKCMRKGAAMFPRAGMPNTNTNISMSAHRTGSAAFFKDFDQVQKGDEILLHTRTLGSFRYVVDGVAIVENDDWTTTYSVGYPALTLISCEEFGDISNGKRIVVRGQLVGRATR